MNHPIFVKRDVKEKLPKKGGRYHTFYNEVKDSSTYFRVGYEGSIKWGSKLVTHWLESVELEEYLKEIGLTVINK